MKHLKNFKDNASFEAYLGGGEIDYPVIAKVEDEIHVLTPPTIYYTTTDGNKISDSNTGLSSYIVSHMQEENGEWKIILKKSMTSIPNDCFSTQTTLKTIRFENMENITTIGANFLIFCINLTSIDLSSLSNVKSIGNYFLSDCYEFTSIDLSPLSNVTNIGDHFFDNSNLKTIDLTPLSNVESIGSSFLHGCNLLKSIDLAPLSNAKSIRDGFLIACSSLTTLTMPDADITSIGSGYLSGCPKLTTIYVPASRLEMYQNLMPDAASLMKTYK